MPRVQDTHLTDAGREPRRKARGKPATTLVVSAPPGFERLTRFFSSQSALARALGVHRDTIRAWEQGAPTRLRVGSVARVRSISAVAEEVARYLPDDALVGRWLLAPQIALGGRSAAAFIQDDPLRYRRVLRLVERDAEPVSVGDGADLTGPVLGEAERPTLGTPAPDPDADPDFLATLS